jgi:hypothetical protein
MESILKYEGCEGILSWEKYTLKLHFDLIVTIEGEIQIDVEAQPLSDDNIWVEIAYLQKSATAEILKLKGRTSEGYCLESDSVFLTKSHTSTDKNGSVIKVEATASHIDIRVLKEAPTESGAIRADFWVAGLQCFQPIKIKNESGEIYIAGSSKIDNFSKICGIVSQKTQGPEKTDEKWFESVKEHAERILNILSFANGRFLRANILKVYQGEKLTDIVLYRHFSNNRPYKPPFSYLHLQPIIEIGIMSYTKELISRTGMNVALEWHLMPHTYNEDRYLAQMTALEHLVHVFRENRQSNRALQKSKFRNIVRPALQEKLDELLPQLYDDFHENDYFINIIEEFKGKIGNLNMQTLQSSLNSMLAEYRVPLDGLMEFIPDLIKVRNKIVHRGLHSASNEQRSLGTYLSAAEELLRRIFLSLLDFDGSYQTYFKTVEFRRFSRLPIEVIG